MLCRADMKEYAADVAAMRAGVARALCIAVEHLTLPRHLLVLIDLSLIARCAMLGAQNCSCMQAWQTMCNAPSLAGTLSWLPVMVGQQRRGTCICTAMQSTIRVSEGVSLLPVLQSAP